LIEDCIKAKGKDLPGGFQTGKPNITCCPEKDERCNRGITCAQATRNQEGCTTAICICRTKACIAVGVDNLVRAELAHILYDCKNGCNKGGKDCKKRGGTETYTAYYDVMCEARGKDRCKCAGEMGLRLCTRTRTCSRSRDDCLAGVKAALKDLGCDQEVIDGIGAPSATAPSAR